MANRGVVAIPVDDSGVRRVLAAFDEQAWEEVHLVTGDVEVHLVASPTGAPADETSHVWRGGTSSGALSTEVITSAPPAAPMNVDAPGTVEVCAPSPGLFWRAPSPGAPPYTDAGASIVSGSPMCIVEVMKLMNTVPAPVDGTVVAVGAANGEHVEKGQMLFRIRPVSEDS